MDSAGPLVTVTLTDRVKLGADWLMPGDIREVTPEEAAALMAVGVVATDDLAGEPPPTTPPVAPAKPSARVRAAKG